MWSLSRVRSAGGLSQTHLILSSASHQLCYFDICHLVTPSPSFPTYKSEDNNITYFAGLLGG